MDPLEPASLLSELPSLLPELPPSREELLMVSTVLLDGFSENGAVELSSSQAAKNIAEAETRANKYFFIITNLFSVSLF